MQVHSLNNVIDTQKEDVHPFADPSFLQTRCKSLAGNLKYLIHYDYEATYIKIDPFVLPVAPWLYSMSVPGNCFFSPS